MSLYFPHRVRVSGVGVKKRLKAKFGVRKMVLFWLVYLLFNFGMLLNLFKPQFPPLQYSAYLIKFLRIK